MTDPTPSASIDSAERETAPEFCWLVELFEPNGGNSMGFYHTGFTTLGGDSRSTKDPHQAKRYPSKAQAAAVAANLLSKAGVWRPIEHGFASPAALVEQPSDEHILKIAEGWGLHHAPDTAKGFAREILAVAPVRESPAVAAPQAVLTAAQALLDEIDTTHDTLPPPQKYGVPYGAVNALRLALDSRCKYVCPEGQVCTKCGRRHDGGAPAAEQPIDNAEDPRRDWDEPNSEGYHPKA